MRLARGDRCRWHNTARRSDKQADGSCQKAAPLENRLASDVLGGQGILALPTWRELDRVHRANSSTALAECAVSSFRCEIAVDGIERTRVGALAATHTTAGHLTLRNPEQIADREDCTGRAQASTPKSSPKKTHQEYASKEACR
jgi:hypothetical protein